MYQEFDSRKGWETAASERGLDVQVADEYDLGVGLEAKDPDGYEVGYFRDETDYQGGFLCDDHAEYLKVIDPDREEAFISNPPGIPIAAEWVYGGERLRVYYNDGSRVAVRKDLANEVMALLRRGVAVMIRFNAEKLDF